MVWNPNLGGGSKYLHFFEKSASHSFASKYTKDGHGGLLDSDCRWHNPLYWRSWAIFRSAARSPAAPGRQASSEDGSNHWVDHRRSMGGHLLRRSSYAVAGRRTLVEVPLRNTSESASIASPFAQPSAELAPYRLKRLSLLLLITEKHQRSPFKLDCLPDRRQFERVSEPRRIQNGFPCSTLLRRRRGKVH